MVDEPLWTGNDVATYLALDARYVKEKLLMKPDAPKAIRMYKRGQPRYEPADVKAWAGKFKK
jgi:phage pi2 protein 07